MIPSSFPDASEIARLSAGMLLEIEAVHLNAREPFTLASGLPSPTYIDCRKLISFPRIRTTLMDFLTCTVMREAGFVDVVVASKVAQPLREVGQVDGPRVFSARITGRKPG